VSEYITVVADEPSDPNYEYFYGRFRLPKAALSGPYADFQWELDKELRSMEADLRRLAQSAWKGATPAEDTIDA
jgi:hypothetical protein